MMLERLKPLKEYFFIRVSHKIGEVHDGAATMDWMEQEQERYYNYIRSNLQLKFPTEQGKTT